MLEVNTFFANRESMEECLAHDYQVEIPLDALHLSKTDDPSAEEVYVVPLSEKERSCREQEVNTSESSTSDYSICAPSHSPLPRRPKHQPKQGALKAILCRKNMVTYLKLFVASQRLKRN